MRLRHHPHLEGKVGAYLSIILPSLVVIGLVKEEIKLCLSVNQDVVTTSSTAR